MNIEFFQKKDDQKLSKPRITEGKTANQILVTKSKPRIVKTANTKPANNEGRLYVQLSPIKNQYNLLAKSGHCFSQGVLHDHTDYEGLIGFSILAIASNQLGQQPGQQPAF